MLCSSGPKHPRDAVTTTPGLSFDTEPSDSRHPVGCAASWASASIIHSNTNTVAGSLVERSELGNTAQYFGGALQLVRTSGPLYCMNLLTASNCILVTP